MLLRQWFGKNQSIIPPTSTTINRKNNSNILLSKLILEHLPNELLFVIFDYLYCHEIIYAFDKLNSHFQSLLDSYLFYHLILSDEKIQSKLNLIRQLPLNTEHVKSLILSDNPNSIINLDKFLSIYPMEIFSSTLQCLSLNDFDEKLMISIVFLLPNFQQLNALSLSNKYATDFSSSDEDLLRDVILFTINTLRYFTWNIKQSIFNINSTVPDTHKSRIEYFQFDFLSYDALPWLNVHTLNLKSIFISTCEFSRSLYPLETFEKLVFLKLHNINSKSNIQLIFECLTGSIQLKQLELHGQLWNEEDVINGYKWEDFIENYIPQLEIFNFFFTIIHWTTVTKLNQMVESFKTNFWLIKHKWFITCDYQSSLEKTYFYSIPCIQTKLEYSHSWIQISTTTTIYNDTRYIHQLTFDSIDMKYLESYHRFTHIQSLILRHVHNDITYDQLNKLVNLSSITRLEFQSKENYKLLFDLLKFCSALISIGIDYKLLTEIIQQERHLLCYLKKIQSLKLTYSSNIEWQKTDIDNFSSYFSNIEQLIVEEYLDLSEIAYLIGSFEHLYFLVAHCSEYKRVQNDNIQNKLFGKQNRKFKKKSIIYRWMKDIIHIWLE